MNDAATVCRRECVGDLQADLERGFQFERTSGDELAHVLAFNKLHRDVVNSVDFIEIEDGADVWMVQRRGETCFAFESFEICLLCAQLGWDYLDDNGTAQLCVSRLVNRSLPAHAELLRDAIVAERLA